MSDRPMTLTIRTAGRHAWPVETLARRIADALYGHVARPESKGEGSAPGSWHVHVGANDVWLHPTPDPHEWRLVHRYGFDPSVGPFLAYVLHATVEADR